MKCQSEKRRGCALSLLLLCSFLFLSLVAGEKAGVKEEASFNELENAGNPAKRNVGRGFVVPEDSDEEDHEDGDDHDHEDEDSDHEDEDSDHEDEDHEDGDDHDHEDEDSDHEDEDHEDGDDHDHEDGDDHDHEDGDDHDHEEGDDHDHEDGDDHDHAHGAGMNYTINGEEVTSPGVLEIMERYDENEDGYLNFEEYEHFFDEVMEGGGEGDDHSEHDHRRRRDSSFQRKVSGEEPAFAMVQRVSRRRWVMRADDDHDHGDCLSADEMFEEFDLDDDDLLNSVEVLLVCPDMLVQILDGCADEDDLKECEKISTSEAWLYGMMSTLGISLLSAVGVLLIPVHNKKVKEYLINALIAFAVGALFGDVILHVIPHALGLHAHGGILDDVGGGRVSRELWLGLTICAGFFLFTVLDLSIRGIKAKYGASDEEVEKMIEEIEEAEQEKNKSRGLVRKLTGFDEKKIRYRDIKAVGYLNLVSDGVHNFIDGITIGIAWVDSFDLGLTTTIAIVAHEIPQELGDFGILIHSGFTKWQAILWNLISASFAMLGAIVGLAVATTAEKAIPWFLALAAGNFLYISCVSMMPEALKGVHDMFSALACLFLIALGFAILFIIAVFLEDTDCV